MIGKLILTHGGLARELLSAANVISGRLNGFEALSLDWSEGFDEARGKVSSALERLDTGQGVLILTDMYGGTPSNVAVTFLEAGRVEAIAGVSLPMLVRALCYSSQPLDLVVKKAVTGGLEGVINIIAGEANA